MQTVEGVSRPLNFGRGGRARMEGGSKSTVKDGESVTRPLPARSWEKVGKVLCVDMDVDPLSDGLR